MERNFMRDEITNYGSLKSYVMPLVVLLVVLVGAKIAGVDDGPAAVATLVGVAIYYVGLYLARRRFDRVIKFTIIKE